MILIEKTALHTVFPFKKRLMIHPLVNERIDMKAKQRRKSPPPATDTIKNSYGPLYAHDCDKSVSRCCIFYSCRTIPSVSPEKALPR